MKYTDDQTIQTTSQRLCTPLAHVLGCLVAAQTIQLSVFWPCVSAQKRSSARSKGTKIYFPTLLSVVLFAALTLMLSSVNPAHAAFPDISNAEVRTAAETLSVLGIVTGFEDGTFRPNAVLTRGQFAKMAIICLDAEERAALYQSYTVFPDVLSGHWAAGYVNAAVKESRILSGYPDGTFRPDASISEAEAVTICLRMLGYREEDIGVFWPADYLSKAHEIGLTAGLTIHPSEPIMRGRAAQLLCNLLVTERVIEGKVGSLFALEIGQTATTDAILLATPRTDLSLAQGIVRVSVSSGATPMAAAVDLPIELVGRQGVLLSGRDGKVSGFIPFRHEVTQVIVQNRDENGVTTSEMGKVIIPMGTTVVQSDRVQTYRDCWFDLRRGLAINLYYDSRGVLAYIAYGIRSGTVSQTAHVLTSGYSRDKNPLLEFYSAELVSKTPIYKYETSVDATMLAKNDVVSYNETLGRFIVSTERIAGAVEEAYPSRERAQSILMYGITFSMHPGYTPDLSRYGTRQVVTLLLSSEGTVAGVVPEAQASVNMVGLLSQFDFSGRRGVITLSNGYVLNVDLNISYGAHETEPSYNRDALYDNCFVELRVGPSGVITARPPNRNAAFSDWNLATMRIGTSAVTPNVAIYEGAGSFSEFMTVPLEDVQNPAKLVRGADIVYHRSNAQGMVDVIVLNNVTGNAYTYGKLHEVAGEEGVAYGLRYDSGAGTGTVSEATLTTAITPMKPRGPYVGFSVQGGILRSFSQLIKESVVLLEDFIGSNEVRVGNYQLRIADNVQVYDETRDRFVTLAYAKTHFSKFAVHIDKPAAAGGIVRIITVSTAQDEW